MLCPQCLHVMKCISEIHDVPGQPGRQRMDLHCANFEKRCRRTHMGVITEDPKEWVCHEYSFELKFEDKSYLVRSYSNKVDPVHQHRPEGEFTSLALEYHGTMVKVPKFMPITTGDLMHEGVWDVFRRLKNLVAFS